MATMPNTTVPIVPAKRFDIFIPANPNTRNDKKGRSSINIVYSIFIIHLSFYNYFACQPFNSFMFFT